MALQKPPRGHMFTLRLFGGLALEGPSGPVSGRVAQRRRLGLLALLGVAGEKGLSRDKLAGYLWPETDESNAKHLLSDSLYVLRKELGEDALLSSGEFLRLNAEVVECDLRAFETALEGKQFEEALSFYAGPFLDGFYLGGEGEFDAWVESERQRLAELYAKALKAAAEEAQAAGDAKRAVEWWKKLAAYDPFNSRVILRLMEALAAAGDPANALELLRVHELRLRDELGLELPEDLRAFAERLRTEPVAGLAGAGGGGPARTVPLAAESVQGFERWLRAEVFFDLGRYDEARHWYEGFGEIDTQAYMGPARFRLGEIYERLGDPEKAAKHYNRLLQRWKDCDPDLQPWVESARRSLEALSPDT